MSLIELSLRWISHHGGIDSVILGASRLEQLQYNLTALAEGPLPPGVLERCDEVWRRLRGVSPQYNR
jgi:aryl-alcohol dehydrogenase-like predicted oxidoreductase